MAVLATWQCFALWLYAAFGAPGEDLCLQEELLYDCTPHRDRYSWVCCNNERWAEHSGFLGDVDFFGGMERDGYHTAGEPVVFYDAKCGVPLFKAPVGRTWDAWKQESLKHGWPSFRREETIYEHVKEVGHGETVSSCGTHLGHNLPDSKGDRYCINLICMAGQADHTGPIPESGDGAQEVSNGDGTLSRQDDQQDSSQQTSQESEKPVQPTSQLRDVDSMPDVDRGNESATGARQDDSVHATVVLATLFCLGNT